MSLDTLLEAAKYLDKIEANGDVSNMHLPCKPLGSGTGQYRNGAASESIPIPGGHLRMDPNLPISFHFHTYSSQAPGPISTGCLSFPVKSTNLKNTISTPSHSEAGSRQVTAGSGASARSYRGCRGSRSSSGSTGDEKDAVAASNRHRELHKTLEKNRRAHLRCCFEQLKQELPKSEYSDKKTSHINIIHCAIKYIQCLKRSELDYINEMERLSRTKIRYQTQLSQIREDLMQEFRSGEVDAVLREVTERVLRSGTGNGDQGVIVDGISPVGYMDEDNSEGDVIVDMEPGHDYDDESTASGTFIFF